MYNLIALNDTLELNAKGDDTMTKKQQYGSIKLNQAGVNQIIIYPKLTTIKANKRNYNFKGLELVSVE